MSIRRPLAIVLALAALLAVGAAGCADTANAATTSPWAVIRAFRAHHLEVGKTRAMEPDDYGFAPLVARSGVRFLIPSLGEDNGGRVMAFRNVSDLRKVKRYYDGLGRASAVLFSWTFANEGRRILVQINGQLSRAKATRYGRVVKSL